MGASSLVLPAFARDVLVAADPAIPTPQSVLGFEVGADYRLASYQQALIYFKALAAASGKLRLVEIGRTSMDQPMMCAIISSEANLANLDRLREISAKLALAEDVDEAEARQLAAEGRAVVYIDAGLHATEVAPPQHNLQLAYDLLTSQDAATQFILDNTVLLLNFANPDGMDMVAQWYQGNVGTPYELSPLPRLYHLYAGHDNNRDSYMLNLSETRAIQGLQFRTWYPVFQINHHQISRFPTRASIPPLPEPLNPNIHPLLTRWKNVLGSMMGAAYDRNGQSGVISRIVIDGWAPDMFDSVGDLFNTVSTSPEFALHKYATPRYYQREDLPPDYRDFVPSIFYPNPWKGGWWRLWDAVDYILTCSKSTLHTAATFREQLLLDKYRMARETIARYRGEPPHAYIIPRRQWDPPVAAELLNRLMLTGVQVCAARDEFHCGGQSYPAGTWVIPMTQAFANYVKTLFERQAYPDLSRYPDLWQGVVRPQRFGDAHLPPYDAAGWTLPLQMGVEVVAAQEPLTVALERIEEAKAPRGSVQGTGQHSLLIPPAFNNAFIVVNRLLRQGFKVMRARADISADGRSYPAGTWIVRFTPAAQAAMERIAGELGVDVYRVGGFDPASVSSLSRARLGLYQSWVPSMDEGWTRWLLEQYEFAYSTVHDAQIRQGRLAYKYDVLVIADHSTRQIVEGHSAKEMPAQYAGGITERGVRNISAFVHGGGTLVLLNGSVQFALEKLSVPVADALGDVRAHEDEQRDRTAPELLKFTCPGSLLRAEFDVRNPIAYGMPATGTAVFADGVAFNVDAAPEGQVRVIARYPASGELLLSGFLAGGEYLHGKAAAVEVALGKGRVILIGFGSQRRAQPHQTFKLLFNSIFYAAAR